jgi:NUDIX domain
MNQENSTKLHRARKVKHKVFAYITHCNRLLVFVHPFAPEAGIQIPAGTIKANERPEEAVLREAFEEIRRAHPGLSSGSPSLKQVRTVCTLRRVCVIMSHKHAFWRFLINEKEQGFSGKPKSPISDPFLAAPGKSVTTPRESEK